ncbi:P-loop NTPase fold protein [Pseudomonas abietaniphila]|uniref:KAP family P-loop NTPase fold protein n=1 Tax=Pseudomonas abietaniphila TaxID=89065 RepID=UPI0032170BE3
MRRDMPAVLDRHIEQEKDDAFGHRHYAQALRSLIENEGHRPPYSIGLLGGWGTGKSSIKEMYTHALIDDTGSADGRRPRSQRFKSITFNAWRFGGKEQDIKRALLRHVFLELGGDEGKLHDDLYRNVTHTETVEKSVAELTKQHLFSWVAPLPAFLIAVITYLLFVAAGLKWLPLETAWVQSLFVAAVTGIYAYLLKLMKPSAVSPFQTVTRVHLPSASAEQYEEMLLQQLRKFKATKNNAVPYERLVIFVDDLDRLSAEEMVLGLDAVRTFMEIPVNKLPDNLGLVFVISCDEGKVADALSRRRGNPEQPGSVFNPTDARRYLDRIFQFRLEIPPPPRSDMRQFALSKLKSFPDLVKDIADRGASIEQVVDRMIHVNVIDPRNALQIINAFTQTWWLAKERELGAIGSERPGGLHEGAVTNYPVALGALSAARVSFPGFYQDLQGDPQLLNRLTNLMVRQASPNDEPLETRYVLNRYVTRKDGEEVNTVADGQRDLRQFLASLVGIQWPASLQSLLLLSEDFATRQYGPHASRIYGYLVSGDTQGFLEALSPRANESLSDQETQLLHGMLSELHRTEDTLKFNAMRVVADIIDRLPARTRNLVLGILTNDIVTSSDLRSLLGVEKIGRITAVSNPVDQKQIASVLIDELLTTNKLSTMRLQSGQMPNLEETIQISEGAAQIALTVFSAHGLVPASKDRLMEWLSARTVRTVSGSISLPFGHLQRWMDAFETSLLPEIGPEYVNELTTALHGHEYPHDEGDLIEGLDMNRTIHRINVVWDRLSGEGDESRHALWEQVTNLATMGSPPIVSCVIGALEQYVLLSDEEELLKCLARFSIRIADFRNQPIEFDRAFRLIVDLGAERKSYFTDETTESYTDLAITLSTAEGHSQDAAEVLRAFVMGNPRALSRVVDHWINYSLSAIPAVCRNVLFEEFGSLDEDDQTSLVGELTSLANDPELDDQQGALYTDATVHIPSEHWSGKLLRPHLDTVVSGAHSKLASWDDYLRQLIPGISNVFMHASPAVLGPALQKLFSAAKGREKVFESLHEHFCGRWPTVEQLPHGYAPQTLFNEARQQAKSSPTTVGKYTLASMESMITSGCVAVAHRAHLVETACEVWQQHPDQAVDYLTSGQARLTVPQLAELVEGIDFGEDEQVGMLERAWTALIPQLPVGEYVDAAKAVLLKGPRGNLKTPDLAFTVWCRALDIEAFSDLKSLLLSTDINDEQRKRVYGHIVRADKDDKETTELPSLALQMLQTPESPLTWTAVHELRSEIRDRLATHEERLTYARLLLRELPKAASDTAKGYMAAWAKTLGTEALLKELNPAHLSEGDLQIIHTAFGTSRPMAGLKKRWFNKG